MSSRLRLQTEEPTPAAADSVAPAGSVHPAASTAAPRYDAETQQKIIALASRLQQERDATLNAEQLAAAGAEVGLEPAFVREAVARLEAAEEAARAAVTPSGMAAGTAQSVASATPVAGHAAQVRVAQRQRRPSRARLPAKHLRSRLIGVAWAAFFGIFLTQTQHEGPVPALVIPGLIALTTWLGGVLGRKRDAFWTGAALVLVTLLTASLGIRYFMPPFVLLVFLMAAGGLTGAGGAWLAQWRERREPAEEETEAVPTAGHDEMNRAALLEQMFALQRQLAGQKRRAAFLSVDVVGSSQIKQAARTAGDELAVEHAFLQYHRWVEEVVRRQGGRMQMAAGDGMMCLFEATAEEGAPPPEVRAVRAARELQTQIAAFNTALSGGPLAAPLRLRCGVSTGEVAIEPGAPLGHLQSNVIDRAAVLQRRAAPGDIVVDEAAAIAALTELGALAPLSGEDGGGPRAFSWRAAVSPGSPR